MSRFRRASRSHQYRFVASRMLVALCAALILNLVFGAGASAATNPVQVYYVPLPEDQAMSAFSAIQPNFGSSPSWTNYRIHSIISIIPTRSTIIYYDQWEDGYEQDLTTPTQSTTQIWGDGNTANGTAPGYPTDLINAGSVIVQEQDVPLFNPPAGTTARAAGSIFYDGQDKIGASASIALTRGVLPTVDCTATVTGVCTAGQTNVVATVIAGSPAVAETRLWGLQYTLPVGENTLSDEMFQYVSPFVMAAQDGTVVQIDADANGTFETTTTLNQGQSYLIPAATVINAGATISASKPVQVHMATGDVSSLYESRWYQLAPVDQWSNNYISPVSSSRSTTSNSYNGVDPDPTHYWVYNPGTTALTVSYETGTNATGALTPGTFSVPAKSVYRFTGMTDGAGRGVRFSTAGNTPFYVIGTVDSNGANGQYVNDIHDWGFTLIPATQLTDSAIVGWAPSTYDTSAAGNPVWVTAATATTVYIDYDANPGTGPLTDPNGNKYNVSYTLAALQAQRVENPSRNNTGMRLYTINKTKIAVAWGQDPDTAQVVYPYLDLGYTVPPLPSYSVRKDSALVIDTNANGIAEPGETIEYTITISNNGPSIVDGVTLLDTLPGNVTYVPNSTTVDGVAAPDNSSPNTTFPLDETGTTLNNIPVRTLTVAGETIVKFRVTINAPLGNAATVTNQVTVNTNQGNTTNTVVTQVRSAALGDRIWLDEDGDGYLDAGEPGLPNVTVNLIDNTSGTTIATTTTDANGGYRFTGLPAGIYRVDVVNSTLPTGFVQSSIPASTGDFTNHADNIATFAVTAGGEVQSADFGFNAVASSSVTGNTGTGSIGDRVWNDADGDGILDAGESGISGVTVTLYSDPDGDGVYSNSVQMVATDASGSYFFTNVPAGAYQVVVTPPAGTTQTGDPDYPGTGVLAANRDHRTTMPILLAPGDVYVNADFGYQYAAGAVATIGDQVYFDANGDGTFQPNGTDGNPTTSADNEYGIAGVTVALIKDTNANGVIDAGEPIIAATTTNASGLYSFTGVAPGRYVVQVNDTANVLSELAPRNDADGLATPNRSAVTVAAGATDFVQDFGYAPAGHAAGQALIGDFVFLDANGNNLYDSGESGIEGVTVQLYSGLTLVGTTTTDENGRYTFGNLPGSTNYTVRVTAPTGYTNSVDPDGATANESAVNLAAGAINLNQDFGYKATGTAGTIGNLIWNDVNGNGVKEAAETGISNVTVDVYRDLNGNGLIDAGEPRIGTRTTDAGGAYTFAGLTTDDGGANAQYVVDVSDINNVLSGWWRSTGTANTDNNSQRDPFAVTLTAAAATNTTADFGYYRTTARVGDLVWNDVNRNGVQDSGEPGIAGVRVSLLIRYANGTSITVVTTTDSNGMYGFSNLVLDENLDGAGAGEPTFVITVAQPAGFVPTQSNSGADDTKDSDGSAAVVTISEGTAVTTWDFGFYAAPGMIGNLVWLDVDGDGVQDVGEPGLSNVTVRLMTLGADNVAGTPDDVQYATTVTDANGNYLFTNIPANTYYVDIDGTTVPGGLSVTAGTTDPGGQFVLAAGGTNFVQDFGYRNSSTTTAIIGDFIWSDADADGVQDLGEPGIGGVTLALKGAGPDKVLGTADDTTVATTTTAADGTYFFTGVAAGEYVVDVTDTGSKLVGYTLTSGAQSSSDPTAPISVTAGAVYLNADFGYTQAGLFTFSDKLYFDNNPAAGKNTGDDGIEGVTINLRDSTGKVIATTVTDDTGAFTFPGLPNGTYTVTVADTMGMLANTYGTTTNALAGQRSFIISGASNTNGVTFGYRSDGVIGDHVFSDNNSNRSDGEGEPGIAGVTVQLWLDVDGNGIFDNTVDQLVGTTTTSVSGIYNFAGYAPGTYFASIDPAQVALTGYTVTTVDEETGANAPGVQLEVALKNNGVDLDIDFGFKNATLPDISGNIWNDLNVNAAMDPTEPKIQDVTVALMDMNGNILETFTSKASPSNPGYQFNDVPPGTYRVAVLDTNGLLQGYRLTSGTSSYTITVASTGITNLNFGYTRNPAIGSIGDYVWMDADRNGVQNAGESGISGVKLTLKSSTDATIGNADDLVVGVTMTDLYGRYIFGGVPAGNYYVEVDQTTVPAGLSTTTGTTNPSGLINLSAGEIFVQADFGYASTSGSALGDRVWYDGDADGMQDPGEVGIGGVQLTVVGPSGTFNVITDADGSWLVAGLTAGNYTVTVNTATLPSGYNTTPTNGAATRTITIPTGRDVVFADFGFNGGATGTIGDTIYFDADGNRAQGAGEMGLANVTLNLIGPGGDATFGTSDDIILGTTMTSANGGYSFVGVRLSQPYRVQVTDMQGIVAGMTLTTTTMPTTTITPTSATPSYLAADFGYTGAVGSIGDSVWHDLNANGVKDGGEPGIEGVTINLYQDVNGNGLLDLGVDNLLYTTSTDSSGQYQFAGLPAARYLVDVTDARKVLNGFSKTAGTAGTDSNSQTDPYAVNLTGVANVTADFGYRATTPYTVSGLVFKDNTNDGVYTVGPDGRFPGVTLRLYRDLDGNGSIDPGEPLLATTTSSTIDGSYVFPDLVNGQYVVAADTNTSRLNGLYQTTQTTTPQKGVQNVTVNNANVVNQNFGFFGPTAPTAITLTSFTATPQSGGIALRWVTATETQTAGFYLYRSATGNRADAIRVTSELIAATGDGAAGATYSWLDRDVQAGQTYSYWLQEVEAGGKLTEYGPVTGTMRATGPLSYRITLPFVQR